MKISEQFRCPACKTKVMYGTECCPKCTQDLSLLNEVYATPYLFYNQALDSIQKGDILTAFTKAAAAVETGKNFLDGHLLLAHLAGQLGLQELKDKHLNSAKVGSNPN